MGDWDTQIHSLQTLIDNAKANFDTLQKYTGIIHPASPGAAISPIKKIADKGPVYNQLTSSIQTGLQEMSEAIDALEEILDNDNSTAKIDGTTFQKRCSAIADVRRQRRELETQLNALLESAKEVEQAASPTISSAEWRESIQHLEQSTAIAAVSDQQNSSTNQNLDHDEDEDDTVDQSQQALLSGHKRTTNSSTTGESPHETADTIIVDITHPPKGHTKAAADDDESDASEIGWKPKKSGTRHAATYKNAKMKTVKSQCCLFWLVFITAAVLLVVLGAVLWKL